MGILDDIKRLNLYLNEDDERQIEAIIQRVTEDQKDEFIRNPVIEYLLEEYITEARPDILSALKTEWNKKNERLIRDMNRKFDEKGSRICDETLCDSTEGVVQCGFCEKYICVNHNYGKDKPCCYACSLEQKSEKKE